MAFLRELRIQDVFHSGAAFFHCLSQIRRAHRNKNTAVGNVIMRSFLCQEEACVAMVDQTVSHLGGSFFWKKGRSGQHHVCASF